MDMECMKEQKCESCPKPKAKQNMIKTAWWNKIIFWHVVPRESMSGAHGGRAWNQGLVSTLPLRSAAEPAASAAWLFERRQSYLAGRRITFPPSPSSPPPAPRVSTVNKKRKNESRGKGERERERMSVLKAQHANSRLVIYMRRVPRLGEAVLNKKRARPPDIHTYWYTARHRILPPLLKYSKPSRRRPFLSLSLSRM